MELTEIATTKLTSQESVDLTRQHNYGTWRF